MKNLLKFAALCCCVIMTQGASAADASPNAKVDTRVDSNVNVYGDVNRQAPAYSQDYSNGQVGYAAQAGECPPDSPCPSDQQLNDCWCLYVHYEPCYYTTKRCVEEQIPCTKKCYRKVPKYYEVKKCRMVPEYYCETKCKYETECYEVADTKCCTKVVCDTHCKYVPKYYWKHVCGNPDCTQKNCQPANR